MWRRHQQSSCVTTSLQLRTLKPTNWWMRRDDDDNRWPLEVALYASKNHWQLLHTRLCITRVVRDLNKAAGAAWSTMFTPRRSSITARSTRPWSGSRIRVHSCPSGMRPAFLPRRTVTECAKDRLICFGFVTRGHVERSCRWLVDVGEGTEHRKRRQRRRKWRWRRRLRQLLYWSSRTWGEVKRHSSRVALSSRLTSCNRRRQSRATQQQIDKRSQRQSAESLRRRTVWYVASQHYTVCLKKPDRYEYYDINFINSQHSLIMFGRKRHYSILNWLR